jgi:1,4-alpha-glucan branching enzyme
MTAIRHDGLVEFRFYRPAARSVFLTGDFNRWAESDTPMSPEGDGWWVASRPFAPGEYRFRYIADGTAYADYASYGVEANRKGGWDAVLVVPPQGKEAFAKDKRR